MAQATKTPTLQATKAALRPLHDRLLVKRLENGDEKHGSIIIPDPPRRSPRRARSLPSVTAR
jgi:co-chaperonin GroES (HSP10)